VVERPTVAFPSPAAFLDFRLACPSKGSLRMNDAAPRSEEIRLRFLKVDTSNVADVLDDMDLPNQGLATDFKPYPASAGKLAGWAYTIRGQMAPYSGTGDAEKMRACQGLTPGDVSVWSGDGEEFATSAN
jgi:hypothetical protein